MRHRELKSAIKSSKDAGVLIAKVSLQELLKAVPKLGRVANHPNVKPHLRIQAINSLNTLANLWLTRTETSSEIELIKLQLAELLKETPRKRIDVMPAPAPAAVKRA